jgi:hypothetical protein
MTKRISTVYALLFVCVFTFALAFTLTSETMAGDPGPICCYTWCAPPYDHFPSYRGHPGETPAECEYDGKDTCDFAYQCPEQ